MILLSLNILEKMVKKTDGFKDLYCEIVNKHFDYNSKYIVLEKCTCEYCVYGYILFFVEFTWSIWGKLTIKIFLNT